MLLLLVVVTMLLARIVHTRSQSVRIEHSRPSRLVRIVISGSASIVPRLVVFVFVVSSRDSSLNIVALDTMTIVGRLGRILGCSNTTTTTTTF